MAGVRTQRHNGSLGDSWGSAEYSDDNVSIDSADSLSDHGNHSDYFEEHGRNVLEKDDEDDMATPMPLPRTTRASQTHQDTPTKNSTSRLNSRPQIPRSGSRQFQQPTPQQSPEPTFIMPSLNASVDGFSNASPLRNSQFKSRKPRQTSTQSQTSQQIPRFPPAGSHQIASRSSSSAQGQQQENGNPWHFVALVWNNIILPILGYIFDIFKISMNSLKPLANIFMPIAVLVLVLQFGSTYLKNTFESSLTSFCGIPGSSYILPFCANTDRQADFEELVNIQSTFEDILSANKDSYALPANMKKSQVAMRDLRIQVRFSQLPSKAELENEISDFIDTAREASDDLAKYNARIGYVTDQLISTNKWTLTVLNGIASSESSKGALSEALAHMNIFSVFSGPSETLQQRIFAQYVNHVAKTKEDISSLIVFSESLIMLLNNLDSRLDIIAEIAMRDDNRVMRDREELLAHLWSKLGGNRSSKAANKASLQLLRDVLRYRANAVQLVSATLLKLREISQGLENLRDGVAAPEVVGYREDYPLQWHIDVVSRSVERLRDARGEAMAIEREVMRKGMSEGMGGEGVKQLPPGEMPTVYAKPKEL